MHPNNDKHILVLGAQVPFVRGGAELLNEGLVDFINQNINGVSAEHVNLPFKWYPETQIINDILAWRFLDITEADGKEVDLVVATKFPSYAASHPNKVLWLVHQHRCFYDLEGTAFDYHRDDLVRNRVRDIDTRLIQESRSIYTISNTVSDRLKKYSGIEASPLFPPSRYAARISPGSYEDYVLFIGRLEKIKRPDLLVRAIARTRSSLNAVFVGSDRMQGGLASLVAECGVDNKCRILGRVTDEELLKQLANARAVFYAPYDEDYGYAAVEAFQAEKPVLTCKDSGEVAKLVEQTGAGWVVESDPAAIAEKLDELATLTASQLHELAVGGAHFASSVTWDTVFKRLIEPHL